jgi:tetratricopeptide (TPR) repeat protein
VPALAFLVLLAGCATNQEAFSSAPPSLHVGQVALDVGEPAIAASVATGQLESNPGNLDALLLRASAQAALGQTAQATAGFRQVIAADPGSTAAALGLSRLITASDPAAAEAVLGGVVAHGNATAAVWNNLGVARDLLNRHAEAQDAYRKALAADPSMQGAQVNLARSLAMVPAEPTRPQQLVQQAPPAHPVAPDPAPPMVPPPAVAVSQAAPAPAPQIPLSPVMTPVAPLAQPEGPPPVTRTPGPAQPTQAEASVVTAQACAQTAPGVASGPADTDPVDQWPFGVDQQHQAALRLAEAALQCNPSDVSALRKAVYAAINVRDYSRARVLSDAAVQVAPNDARSHLMSADTDRALGNYARALVSLRKARALADPPTAEGDAPRR